MIQQGQGAELWQALVREGGARHGVSLDEELESYLVFVLMRHARGHTLASEAAALSLLAALELAGREREEQLRDLGDSCLIVSGLFPGLARRRRVTPAYFIALGRSAYGELASALRRAEAALYARLAETFAELSHALDGVRLVARPEAVELAPQPTGQLLNRSDRRH